MRQVATGLSWLPGGSLEGAWAPVLPRVGSVFGPIFVDRARSALLETPLAVGPEAVRDPICGHTLDGGRGGLRAQQAVLGAVRRAVRRAGPWQGPEGRSEGSSAGSSRGRRPGAARRRVGRARSRVGVPDGW